MTRRFALIIACAAIWLASPAAEPQEFRVVRLAEGAAIFQIGTESTTNVVALASRRGLVVVDTGVLPSRGAALRSAIEREFGRRDFAYIINTHSHFDHTDGNQAFADVPIVAHQNAGREMTRSYQGGPAIDAFLRDRGGWQTELEGELKTARAGSRDEARIREQMAENAALMDDLRQGRLKLTTPTVLFSDRLTLELGDLTLDLAFFGRAHTQSDLIVHVRQLRLLLVGDLFHATWLPEFMVPPVDVPRWFQVLDSLQSGPEAVERVVAGHGAAMTGDDFRTRVAYLRDVWDGVAAARREGATLAATKGRFPFDTKYPALTSLTRTWRGHDLHLANIETAWRLQSESAARALESLIGDRGWEAAVAEYRKTIAGNERYNVIENELNALGYRYLRSGRRAEAIAVFQINTGAFPQSWNVWDSLGEAYLYHDWEKAEAYYAKSVALNPQNENGRQALATVRGVLLDFANQTTETRRFEPGAPTGLKGPYLGQKAPGLTPQIFAPGIVSLAGHLDFSITFSPDGREIYFTQRKEGETNALMVTRLGKNGWTAPERARFAGDFASNEPHVTPDGRRLYFGSVRPRPGVERADYGIWVVERTAGGQWGDARYHGPGMYVSVARGGNLYLTDITNVTGSGDSPAVVYPWIDGRYDRPQRLGGGVNAPRTAAHVFIAPDESYILFDSSRPGGQGGEGDLFVCFRKPDGSWSDAVNLGDGVNTSGTNFCPSVSPDGKYIFYTRNRDIYWVSARILDAPRAKALGSETAARGEEFGDQPWPPRHRSPGS